MKYVQPHGISDPDAPYINGDPSIARMGSIPPAAAFEHPMRELVAVIDNSMLVPTDSDLQQVAKAVRSQRMNYAEDTGSIDLLSVAYDPPLTNYTIGLPLVVKIRETNTGPSSIDAGAGRVSIRRPNGSETGAGDLPASGLAELVYDGTVFQLINFGGAGGGEGAVFAVNIPYTNDTSPTANTVIADFSPAIPIEKMIPGLIVMVKIANTNNTFSNINIQGHGLKPIYAQSGNPTYPLLPGDLSIGDVLIFVYDGIAFWIYANPLISQSVTFNVSNLTQIESLFAALGRKRISTAGSVTIKLAAGVYGPTANEHTIVTYHADSERITVEGTMTGTVPGPGDFIRNGSSPAHRANDSSFNIAMLRTKYGTEIRYSNAQGGGITHRGPGQINYKNFLVTGANVPGGSNNGVSPAPGSSLSCYGVSVWGGGVNGFSCTAGFLYLNTCHAAYNHNDGIVANAGAAVSLGGGSCPGNTGNGIMSACGSMVIGTTHDGYASGEKFQTTCNGSAGVYCQIGSTVQLHYAYVIVNAYIDVLATHQSVVAMLSGTSFSTITPAANTEGNLNSISAVY